MILKSFNFNFFYKTIVIIIVSITLAYTFFLYKNYWLLSLLLLLLIFLVNDFLNYINNTNKKISQFFEAVNNDDTMLSFKSFQNSKSINKLYESLSLLNQKIKELRIEAKQQEIYFQLILEHAATGIITVNKSGFIIHSNRAAKRLLNLNILTHIMQIQRVDNHLYNELLKMKVDKQKLVTINTEFGNIDLLLKSTSVQLKAENLLLISMHDIKNELDEKEIKSWSKLIRVMMHEIMNSITPITTLSDSLILFFDNANGATEEDEKTLKSTVYQGLEVIRDQGKNIMQFVESYREFTRLPAPSKKIIKVKDLLERIKLLILAKNKKDIKIDVNPSNLELFADESQIIQVILNIVNNAIEANIDNENCEIRIIANINNLSNVEISIIDNGVGISKDIANEIFVPFFTTKDKGTGIGLSISKQIMKLHGGKIKLHSEPNVKTAFIIEF